MIYSEWNRVLFGQFFNSHNSGEEVAFLNVNKELLNSLAPNGYRNFLNIIILKGARNFFRDFSHLIEVSKSNYEITTKAIPEYFGYLSFLILALSEGEHENFTINNVYGRINEFVTENAQDDDWKKIGKGNSLEILSDAWNDLENWTCILNRGELGFFYSYQNNRKRNKRKFADTLARHVVLNKRHLINLIDVLIDERILPGQELSNLEILRIIHDNLKKIKATKALSDLLEDPDYSTIILNTIRNFVSENYSSNSFSSPESIKRAPPIPLKLVFNNLPSYSIKIDKVFIRAQSEMISDCKLIIGTNQFDLYYEVNGYSNRIEVSPEFIKSDFIDTIKKEDQNFCFHSDIKWLYKNHDLNEWIEDIPHNEPVFILLCHESNILKIEEEMIFISKKYKLSIDDYVVLRFEKLGVEEFKLLYSLLTASREPKGRIILSGAFLGERKKIIFKEFDYSFEFKGDISEPLLSGRKIDGSEFQLDKYFIDNETGYKWKIPQQYDKLENFKVYERDTKITTHNYFNLESINAQELSKRLYFVKDNSGRYLKESGKYDIADLPNAFYNASNGNFTRYNSFQNKYIKDYRFEHNSYHSFDTRNFSNYTSSEPGNLLLKFLNSNDKINSNELATLIQQLGKSVDRRTAKRILFYWRHFGYLDFKEYGQEVSVNPPTLFFLKTEGGLKGFLTGSRNDGFIEDLKNKCRELSLKFFVGSHSSSQSWLFPQMVIVYDPYALINKFHKLGQILGININDNLILYQLGALYFQVDLKDFIAGISNFEIYEYDHLRKKYFDEHSLKWIESNRRMDDFDDEALIKYDNFVDKSIIIYTLKFKGINYVIPEYSLAIFYLLSKKAINILKKRIDRNYSGRDCSDLLVPINIPLPFWLERGLLLSNALVPRIERLHDRIYRIYEKIPDSIISVISAKLSQTINLI